jgi:hypothetical protein
MHHVSDRTVAQNLSLSPLRFDHRSSHQPTNRPGTELTLIVNLHPDNLLTVGEKIVLEGLGLDGHWLIVAVLGYMPRLKIELTASKIEFEEQMRDALILLDDLLFNDMVAGYEADGMDDQQLENFETLIVEEMPTIISASETILIETSNVLRNYSPPPHCLEDSILKYLLGYSLDNPYTGRLHFHFVDYENNRPIRP